MAFHVVRSILTSLQSGGGLNSSEANRRLAEHGQNTAPEKKPLPYLRFLRKLWGPVPWLLEASVILNLILRQPVDAAVAGLLLLATSAAGAYHENCTHQALKMLR